MIFDKLDKYTTESVLQGHPDKICDQISDALLDAFLMQDCNAHTAIECLGSGNNLIVAGEISTQNNIHTSIFIQESKFITTIKCAI